MQYERFEELMREKFRLVRVAHANNSRRALQPYIDALDARLNADPNYHAHVREFARKVRVVG